ncbi:hypothetical protein WA026_004527 [Henosepilachna vigintioctopunctata]|uniref:Uncharacterized protein n=1 Tax=Henosepilachna vigintioctopunctata TaxID=420089 RepID=A0AAW1V1W5_9CUCU
MLALNCIFAETINSVYHRKQLDNIGDKRRLFNTAKCPAKYNLGCRNFEVPILIQYLNSVIPQLYFGNKISSRTESGKLLKNPNSSHSNIFYNDKRPPWFKGRAHDVIQKGFGIILSGIVIDTSWFSTSETDDVSTIPYHSHIICNGQGYWKPTLHGRIDFGGVSSASV